MNDYNNKYFWLQKTNWIVSQRQSSDLTSFLMISTNTKYVSPKISYKPLPLSKDI